MLKNKILLIIAFLFIIGIVKADACGLNIDITNKDIFVDDYLDFNLHIKSYENASRHVRIDYLIIDGKNWTYPSEDVLLEGFSNKTLEKHFYLYPILDTGEYKLIVSTICGFDEVKNEKIFQIKEKTLAVKTSGIKFLKFPDEIDIIRGESKSFSVILNNKEELHNLYLKVEGVSSDLFSFNPKNILISKGDINFLGNVTIAQNEKIGEYKIKFVAVSDESQGSAMSTLFIFADEKGLINHMNFLLKDKLNEFLESSKSMHNDNLNDILNQISSSISDSETYFNEGRYSEARKSIEKADTLLGEAEGIITGSQESVEKTVDITIYLVLIFITAVVVIIVTRRLHVRMPKLDIHPHIHIPHLKKAIEENVTKEEASRKEVNPEFRRSLEEEKKKIVNLLLLIKKEYKERTITKTTYTALRTDNEKRLKEIDDKLDEL